MRSSALSKIRIVFSIIVILLLTAVFVDISHLIPEKYINLLLFLQFIPSANKFISAGDSCSNRFHYYSGTYNSDRQDILFISLSSRHSPGYFQQDRRKIQKKIQKIWLQKTHTFLRYSILAITLVVTMIWGVYFLTLLDPYSIFGRIMTYFAKPVVLLLNNLLSSYFGKFDIYTFVHAPVNGIHSCCIFYSCCISSSGRYTIINKRQAFLQYSLSCGNISRTSFQSISPAHQVRRFKMHTLRKMCNSLQIIMY